VGPFVDSGTGAIGSPPAARGGLDRTPTVIAARRYNAHSERRATSGYSTVARWIAAGRRRGRQGGRRQGGRRTRGRAAPADADADADALAQLGLRLDHDLSRVGDDAGRLVVRHYERRVLLLRYAHVIARVRLLHYVPRTLQTTRAPSSASSHLLRTAACLSFLSFFSFFFISFPPASRLLIILRAAYLD
jgi:hypothetical protein